MRERSAWERLQELWVLGDPLSVSEQRERTEGPMDPVAQRELQFYERARRWIDEPPSASQAAEDARFAEHVLRQVRGSRSAGLRLVGESRTAPAPLRSASTKRAVPAVAWLMAGTAAAAGLGLVVRSSLLPSVKDNGSQSLARGHGQPVACQLASFSGSGVVASVGPVRVGESLREGDTLSTGAGTACLTIGGSARLCLPNDSEVVLSSLDPKNIRIEVERGGSIASLSPRPPGSFFSLTGHGVVATAHGTVFALELRAGARAAEVTVFEGSVDVSDASERTLVAAGSRARFDEEGRSLPRQVVDSQEQDRWLSWLATPASNAPAVALAPTDPSPPEAGAQARIPALGSTERTDNTAGLSRDALFAAARKQAGLGNAREARALYRELQTRYPGQGTASVQVVLGNLEMELNAPERALIAYDAYLHSGGPLEPEALHGKVRALRALGRTADEVLTIRNYLARYPNGFQAPSLKKRLQELE